MNETIRNNPDNRNHFSHLLSGHDTGVVRIDDKSLDSPCETIDRLGIGGFKGNELRSLYVLRLIQSSPLGFITVSPFDKDRKTVYILFQENGVAYATTRHPSSFLSFQPVEETRKRGREESSPTQVNQDPEVPEELLDLLSGKFDDPTQPEGEDDYIPQSQNPAKTQKT